MEQPVSSPPQAEIPSAESPRENPVTLNFEIGTRTIGKSIEKLKGLTKLVEAIAKEDVCCGMSRLTISAKIEA